MKEVEIRQWEKDDSQRGSKKTHGCQIHQRSWDEGDFIFSLESLCVYQFSTFKALVLYCAFKTSNIFFSFLTSSYYNSLVNIKDSNEVFLGHFI